MPGRNSGMMRLWRDFIAPGIVESLYRPSLLWENIRVNRRNHLTNNPGCGIMPNNREARRKTMPDEDNKYERWFTRLQLGGIGINGTKVRMIKDDIDKMAVLIEDPADVIEWIWVANDYGAYIGDPTNTWGEAISFICAHAHEDRVMPRRIGRDDAEYEACMDDMPEAGVHQVGFIPVPPGWSARPSAIGYATATLATGTLNIADYTSSGDASY